jgi:hypothetical protein
MNVSCRILLALALVALTAEPVPAEDRPVNLAPVSLVMEDQFQNRCETAAMRGDVVVLVYAGRRGAEAAVELGRRLHTHYHPTAAGAAADAWSEQPVIGIAGWPAGAPLPDVRVIPVACVPEVPKMLRGLARSQLRKGSPVLPVWLDFEDVMRQGFGIVPDEPNVLLLDTAGVARGVIPGQPDEPTYARLVAAIDQLRSQAIPAVRTASY